MAVPRTRNVGLLSALRAELMPFPGRFAGSLRDTLAIVLALIATMTLRVPGIGLRALSALPAAARAARRNPAQRAPDSWRLHRRLRRNAPLGAVHRRRRDRPLSRPHPRHLPRGLRHGDHLPAARLHPLRLLRLHRSRLLGCPPQSRRDRPHHPLRHRLARHRHGLRRRRRVSLRQQASRRGARPRDAQAPLPAGALLPSPRRGPRHPQTPSSSTPPTTPSCSWHTPERRA